MLQRMRIALTAMTCALGASGAFAAIAPDQMADQYGCMSCHGLVNKQVGPGFAQVAARYRGDTAAAAMLAAKIRKGSVGTWGRVIMPAQTKVTEADAQALAIWVLRQPAPAAR